MYLLLTHTSDLFVIARARKLLRMHGYHIHPQDNTCASARTHAYASTPKTLCIIHMVGTQMHIIDASIHELEGCMNLEMNAAHLENKARARAKCKEKSRCRQFNESARKCKECNQTNMMILCRGNQENGKMFGIWGNEKPAHQH